MSDCGDWHGEDHVLAAGRKLWSSGGCKAHIFAGYLIQRLGNSLSHGMGRIFLHGWADHWNIDANFCVNQSDATLS